MKKVCSILMAAALLLTVTACGKASNASMSDSSALEFYADKGDAGFYTEDTYYDSPAAEPKPKTDEIRDLPEGVKMIYTANINLETTSFDEASQGIEKLTEELGGYFENQELYNYGSYRSVNYVIRVPAKNFDTFCGTVGDLARVNSINRGKEDISEQYYDTDARLTTQKTKLERLQELLAQADNMEDIITLENAISDTELMIDQLSGRIRHYDSLVGYSTICLNLNEVYKLRDQEEAAIGFGAKLLAAFKRGTRNFVSDLEDLALGFANGWVGWLIFLAAVLFIVCIVRKLFRRRKIRKAEKRIPVETETSEEK